MMPPLNPKAILDARRRLTRSLPKIEMNDEDAAEGGCGVIGLACEIPVAGRHLYDSLGQMRNRGNGKGGGVAMVGLEPTHFSTTAEVLENSFLVAIAYLDFTHRQAVEEKYIHPVFEVDHIHDEGARQTHREDLCDQIEVSSEMDGVDYDEDSRQRLLAVSSVREDFGDDPLVGRCPSRE